MASSDGRHAARNYTTRMILNIAAYRFVPVDDVPSLAGHIRKLASDAGLLGTVLVAPEGVNLFLAGDGRAVDGVLAALQRDERFAALDVKRSWSAHVPFARLKVKQKREIISFAGREAPIGNARAPAVQPRTLARWLREGHDDSGRPVVLLDTRNREEVAHGTFCNAVTLPIDNFNDLPAAIEGLRGQWAGATVVSFCTGGVRCEKAAPWLAEAGVDHVHQLDGGILRWFEDVGAEAYAGRCFVFDERVALDPAMQPLHDAPVMPVPTGPGVHS